MKIVLRFEVDAYDPAFCDAGREDDVDSENSDPLDTLVNAVSSLSMKSPQSTSAATGSGDLHIIRAGAVVPQRALVKIKTRSQRNVGNLDWDVIYPQLFIGQTPTLKVGVHQKGRFYEVLDEKLDAPGRSTVAREAEKAMKRLCTVLRELHNLAMAYGKTARISVVSRGGALQVMERESSDSFLPDQILKRFDM